MIRKEEKICAFKELFKIAEDGEFDNYAPGGLGGYCLDPIRDPKRDCESALNETLYNLANRNIPDTQWRPYSVSSVNEERHVIQLTLAAGADPNYAHYYSFYYNPETVFDAFMRNGKYYGALEVAKSEGFSGPLGQETFKTLERELRFYRFWGHPYPGDTKTESALYAQRCSDAKELVYTLFSKEMCPYDPQLRQQLQPIFEEEKQRRSVQSKKIQTSTQIYNIKTKRRKNDSR